VGVLPGRTKPAVVGAGCVLLVISCGCSWSAPGSGDGPASGSPALSTPQTTAQRLPESPSPTESTTSCPSSEAPSTTAGSIALPDGKHFGFIRYFDGTAVLFDPAEMLSGKEAVRAAREDGDLAPGQDLPEPFYIRNRDTTPVRIPISRSFMVNLVDNRNAASHHLTGSQLAGLYCGIPLPSWLYADPESLPVHARVSKGLLVEAHEQYLP